jgi:hypothetical protein
MSYDNIKVNNIMIKEKSILLGTTQINGSLKIVDDKSILLGTDNDISIKYDETTNNALEIAANVEGQALGIILKADQGDDAADTWKLNVADGGTITLGNDINSKGTFVDHLTIAPHATVASSTTTVAGKLLVGGDLEVTGTTTTVNSTVVEVVDPIMTIGQSATDDNKDRGIIFKYNDGSSKVGFMGYDDSASNFTFLTNATNSSEVLSGTIGNIVVGTVGCGAITSSGNLAVTGTITGDASLTLDSTTIITAEIAVLDGVTAGTAAASKALVLDANKDIGTIRNLTIDGTLSDGNYTFDTSGNVSGLGTVGCGAITSSGNLAVTGTITGDASLTLDSTTIITAEIAVLDGVTAGTAAASKALVLDANKDIGTIRNLTIDGTLSDGNYTFDTSGNVSGLGTVGCGAITSSGNLAVTGTCDVSGTLGVTGVGTFTAQSVHTGGIQTGGAILSDTTNTDALGSAAVTFSDIFLGDAAVINLGEDQDVTLTHVPDTGVLLNGTMKMQFNDASQFIHGSSATVLSIGATDEIDLTATAIDINGTCDVSGTLTLANSLTSYSTGLRNVISTAVTYSADNDIRSGAMYVPAGSIITDIHVIVTTQLTHGTGTTGVKIGTAADGEQISSVSLSAIQTAVSNTVVGKGTSTNSAIKSSLQGNTTLVISSGQAYRSSDTEVHITVDNSGGDMSGGAIKFVVEFAKLA